MFEDATLLKELDDDCRLGLRCIDVLQKTLRLPMERLGADAPLHRLVDGIGSPERPRSAPGDPGR